MCVCVCRPKGGGGGGGDDDSSDEGDAESDSRKKALEGEWADVTLWTMRVWGCSMWTMCWCVCGIFRRLTVHKYVSIVTVLVL